MKILAALGLGLGGYLLYRRAQRLPTLTVRTVDGLRNYAVYAPTPAPLTLIVLLHGAGGSTRTLAGRGWEDVADRGNAMLAFPEGLIGPMGRRAWNHRVGYVHTPGATTDVDDVGYLAFLIGILRQQHPSIRRVILVGHSNGGAMAYRFASERGDMLGGLVVTNGTIGLTMTDGSGARTFYAPQHPIPVVIFHGGRDNWRGGFSPVGEHHATWQPVAAAVQVYRTVNRADQMAQVMNPGAVMLWHQRWTGTAPVEVVVDRDRGHELPRWNWAGHAWRALNS